MTEPENKNDPIVPPRPAIPELPAMIGLIVIGIIDIKRALKGMANKRAIKKAGGKIERLPPPPPAACPAMIGLILMGIADMKRGLRMMRQARKK